MSTSSVGIWEVSSMRVTLITASSNDCVIYCVITNYRAAATLYFTRHIKVAAYFTFDSPCLRYRGLRILKWLTAQNKSK